MGHTHCHFLQSISGAACIGAGIGPHKIDQVTKTKAILPEWAVLLTEEFDAASDYLRSKGCEFGTTISTTSVAGWIWWYCVM